MNQRFRVAKLRKKIVSSVNVGCLLSKVQLGVLRNILQKLGLHLRVVEVAAIVAEAVAYYYIRYAQNIIICHGLLKGLTADANGGGFVLHDGKGLQLAIVDYGVAAAGHSV